MGQLGERRLPHERIEELQPIQGRQVRVHDWGQEGRLARREKQAMIRGVMVAVIAANRQDPMALPTLGDAMRDGHNLADP